MINVKNYQKFYSPVDKSPLNVSLGKLLEIALAYEGRTNKVPIGLEYEAVLDNAVEVLASADKSDEKFEIVGKLLGVLKQKSRDIGPPTPPDPVAEGGKPKGKGNGMIA